MKPQWNRNTQENALKTTEAGKIHIRIPIVVIISTVIDPGNIIRNIEFWSLL